MDVPETRYTRSGDVSIAYQVAGEGPFDVVLVPSLSHVELAWTRPDWGQVPRRLASFARLIFFDRRGMGMSDRVVDESFETRMDDVRAVMDAAGSTRAALFGILDGGAMSALFAATHPERVSALVLLSSFPRVRWATDYPWGVPAEKWDLVKQQLMQFYFGSREEAVGVARLWRGEEPSDDDLAAEVAYLRAASASPRSLEAFFDTVGEIDIRQALGGIHAPTLLIHGTEAATYPVEGSRYMAERISRARMLELSGAPALPWGADLGRVLDETEAFLLEAWEAGAWEEPELDRVLATVLFTDIVGSTERAAVLGDRAWHELLGRHHELVRRQLVRFRGKEVNTAGDGFFASFDGPARAIRCAQAIVEGVHALGLEVRAGLHTGECELLDGKMAGIAVHTGARVASHAAPGEVLVSSTVRDLVAGSGLTFQDRGSHELKGLPDEWRLFAVEQR